MLEQRGCLHWGRMYVTFDAGEKPWGTVTLNVFQRAFRAISSWLHLNFYSNTRFSVITAKMKEQDEKELISTGVLEKLGRIGFIY